MKTFQKPENFTLEIKLGNSGMYTLFDIATALRKVARELEAYESKSGPVMDQNGNNVGSYETECEECCVDCEEISDFCSCNRCDECEEFPEDCECNNDCECCGEEICNHADNEIHAKDECNCDNICKECNELKGLDCRCEVDPIAVPNTDK